MALNQPSTYWKCSPILYQHVQCLFRAYTHTYIFYNFTSNLPMKDFVSTQHDMLSLLPPGDSTCSGARRGDVGSDQEEGRRTSDERSKVTTRHGRPANEGKVDHPGMS